MLGYAKCFDSIKQFLLRSVIKNVKKVYQNMGKS